MVRLSGPEAAAVLARIAPGQPSPEPRRPTLVRVVDPRSGAEVDRALVTVFVAPESYTGEHMVEISGHGGWLAPALVLDACLAAGARRAEAGEFTRRAYLHGKLDLIQAEAVLDLVEGRSRALHDAALHQLERGLSQRISGLRERLVHLEALLAHHLDFPEEDEPPVSRERIGAEAEAVLGALARLLETAPEGELLREGALTVLAGRPNAGKSSLYNALIGEERAIVTELPGTTRDALEAVVSLGGFPFRLVDTAGLRESEERVERLGIEVARRYLERADLVLLCVEAGLRRDALERHFLEELGERPVVIVHTKVDLGADRPGLESDRGADPAGGGVGGGGAGGGEGGGREARAAGGDMRAAGGAWDGGAQEGPATGRYGGVAGEAWVSVVTGEGLGALKELLPSLVYGGLARGGGDVPVLTRARQTAAVRTALREVTAFADALAGGVPAELAATHLRPAETALEELLGVISTEDVLDRLFREFCIGK